jgi:hypothetical protein
MSFGVQYVQYLVTTVLKWLKEKIPKQFSKGV